MKILMVCLGNICRSPMAQGVLENLAQLHHLSWEIDSAGTNGYHNGEHPDPRAIRAAQKRGIDISRQISRQIKMADLDYFDWILAMDDHNLSYLKSMCCTNEQRGKIKLLMEFAQDAPQMFVPDPYNDHRFDDALDLIELAGKAILANFTKD
ncbi:MAG: low molecular weight phosphotyrosine protein phosphatase [Saprospiraceae bacterium]|nr:low molecular weight phosphotyrosine protein phosphatase [Saprospiraceae bacterium]